MPSWEACIEETIVDVLNDSRYFDDQEVLVHALIQRLDIEVVNTPVSYYTFRIKCTEGVVDER